VLQCVLPPECETVAVVLQYVAVCCSCVAVVLQLCCSCVAVVLLCAAVCSAT